MTPQWTQHSDPNRGAVGNPFLFPDGRDTIITKPGRLGYQLTVQGFRVDFTVEIFGSSVFLFTLLSGSEEIANYSLGLTAAAHQIPQHFAPESFTEVRGYPGQGVDLVMVRGAGANPPYNVSGVMSGTSEATSPPRSLLRRLRP